jgi:arabinosaccharide transport system substrate-binding protein
MRTVRRSARLAGVLTTTALVVAGAAPAAAASTHAQAKKHITLTLWTHDYEYAKFFASEEKTWAKQYPNDDITFKATVLSSSDFWNKELAAMVSGEQLPNLLDLEISHMYLFEKPGLLASKMINLLPAMKGKMSEFLKLEPYEYQGALYGLESALAPVGYYYQPAIFAKYGIKTPITTWQQFYKDGLVLAKHGIAMAPVGGAGLFQSLLYEDGGEFFNSAGKDALNSPKTVQVLSFIQNGIKAGVFKLLGQTEFYTPNTYKLYESGKVAGVIGADWYAGAELEASAPGMKGKWRLEAMPRWPGSSLTTAVFGGTGIGVAKNSPNAKLAESLLLYAYATVQGQVARWKQIGYFPNMIPAMSSPAVTGTAFPYFGGQKLGQIWKAVSSSVPKFYVGPTFGPVETALTNETYSVYLNKTTPTKAAQALGAAGNS